MKENIPSHLSLPPVSEVKPPVDTEKQVLPFLELAWKDFERLCYRLIREESQIESCRLYGIRGQEQEGIDIYARPLSQEKYMVFQCKRYEKLKASVIAKAVKEFLDGEWSQKSSTFVFCTNYDLSDTKLSKEIENQYNILKQKEINFVSWDQQELSTKLKTQPDIVYDFFGLPWVESFCGKEIASEISGRRKLSPAQVIEFRGKLRDFYSIVFSKYDIGLPSLDVSKTGLNLRERFIIPDIIKEREITEVIRNREESEEVDKFAPVREHSGDGSINKQQRTITRTIEARVDIQQILTDNERHIILGEPGVGKSTLLRFITLDLLSDDPKLSLLSEKWGSFLPVWIPFVFLTKKIEGQDISLSELIHLWFKVMDAEPLFKLVEKALDDERLLLLVDGIDEWKDSISAQVAINRLSSFIDSKRANAIITGRPYGYKQLRVVIDNVKIHTLGGFSPDQQREFIVKWACWREKSQNNNLTQEVIEKSVCKTADDILKELRTVPKLTELSKYPLLLSILLSLKLQNLSLPHDRFEAYDKIIKRFLEKHPYERLTSAEITEPFIPMHPEESTSIFEFLAYSAQTTSAEGLIDKKVAKQLIEKYLAEELGCSKGEASRQGREMIEVAKNFIGILIERSNEELGFYHRLLQEYLAARYISRRPFEEQIECIKDKALDPQWSEVIQGIVHEISRKDEIKAIIEALEKLKNNVNLKDRYHLNLLIYQVVFCTGARSCDLQLSMRLFEQAVHDIEFDSWMTYREKVLNIFIEGLHISKLRQPILEKIDQWFPHRFKYGYDEIITKTEQWEETPELINCLWKNIFNSEDIETQKAAAKVLAKRKSGDAEWGDKFAEYCMKYPDLKVRAVMFEGILTGWPTHPIIKKFISINKKSIHHLLKFMSVKGKVSISIQDDKDFDDIIFLSSYLSHIRFDWEDEIIQTIMNGWGKNKKLKERCLDGIDNVYGPYIISNDIAWKILLNEYIDDKELEGKILENIKAENHLFSIAINTLWQIIGKKWSQNKRVSKGVEEWLLKQSSNFSSIYHAALAARSKPVKQKLFSLMKGSFAHWSVKALLDIWGIEDKEVNEKLKEFISSNLKRCVDIAHLLPDIILDKEECQNKLLEILESSDTKRYDTIISGLAKLKDKFDFSDSIDYLLDQKIPTLESDLWRGVAELIQYFPDNKRVKSIAKSELIKSNRNLRPVIKSYHNDPDFYPKIIHAITPFPKGLRSIIVRRLGEFSRLPDMVLPILKNYYLEAETSIHTEASISYHTQLEVNDLVNNEVMKKLSNDINCREDFSEHIIQGAFIGLFILKEFDIIKEKLDDKEPYHSWLHIEPWGALKNIPLLKFIFKHWNKIKELFGENVWKRLFRKNEITEEYWNELADYIDDESEAKQDLMEFIISQTEPIHRTNILNFLGRVKPKSKLLLDTCLEVLKDSVEKKKTNESDLTSTYIIGTHFKGDTDVLNILLDIFSITETDNQLIYILCFGWPDYPGLERFLFKLEKRWKEPTSIGGYAQLICTVKPSESVVNLIDWIFEKIGKSHIGTLTFINSIRMFLIARVSRDNKLRKLLAKQLLEKPSRHHKVTNISLLKEVGYIDEEVLSWCIDEIERQRNEYESPEVGFDIVSGEFKVLMHVLLDVVSL